MKHKFIPAAIMALSLLFGTVANAAGNELPISHGNRYTVNRDGGGEITYTVPFTANYEVTLSGSEGAGYPSEAGGYGYTLTTTVRLNKGQTVTVSTPNRPAHYTEEGTTTTIVPHGNDSVLKIDGKEFLRAGGGAPRFNQIIAPTGTYDVQVEGVNPLPVHWHSGNGKAGATHANQFPTVYSETSVGGCYRWSGHTHNATRTCPMRHNHDLDHKEWRWCCMNENRNGNYVHPSGCSCPGTCVTGEDPYFRYGLVSICDNFMNEYACGNPNNTQVIKCGYSQGQILNVNNDSYQPHTCSGKFTGQSLSNTGNGKFTIRLAEQQELYYSNVVVTTPYYKGGLCELILRDDTVVYYKRK